MADERLLRPCAAYEMAGISKSAARRLGDDFPRPIVLSRARNGRPVRVAYLYTEIQAWIASRIASARGGRIERSPEDAMAPRRDT